MKSNFLFRNRKAAKNYLLKMLLTQVVSVPLFIVLVFLSVGIGLSQAQSLIVSSILVIAYIFSITYKTYNNDIALLRHGFYPIDYKSDLIPFLQKFLINIEKIYNDNVNMKYRTEKLLTDNVQMRKEALAMRAPASLLKKIADAYQKILEIRRDVKFNLTTNEKYLIETQESLKLAEQGASVEQVFERLVTISKIRKERKKLEVLQKQEKEIDTFQKSALSFE